MKRPTQFERVLREIVILLTTVLMFQIVIRVSEQLSPFNLNEDEIPRQNLSMHSMADRTFVNFPDIP